MIKFVRRQSGRDNFYQVWHQAEGNVLLYVHEGQGTLVTADKITSFDKGMLCFIGRHVDHYTLPDLSKNYVRSKFFFDDVVLAQMSTLLGYSLTPQDCIVGKIEDADVVLDWLNENNTVGGCLLLLECLRGAKEPSKKKLPMVEQAILYIHKNIDSNLNVTELCSVIHASKYYFCHKFKAVTGLTVMQYIAKTRVILAKHHIEQGENNMARIGEICGFACQSHFSRVFKEETGLSPLQYRNHIFRK